MQGLVLVGGLILTLLPLLKGENPDVFGISSVILSFLSLLVGELGQYTCCFLSFRIFLLCIGLLFICISSIALCLKVEGKAGQHS